MFCWLCEKFLDEVDVQIVYADLLLDQLEIIEDVFGDGNVFVEASADRLFNAIKTLVHLFFQSVESFVHFLHFTLHFLQGLEDHFFIRHITQHPFDVSLCLYYN